MRYLLTSLLLVMATLLHAAAQPDISKPDETIIRITDPSDFGESDIPGFFFYRMQAPVGFEMDGYKTTKEGPVFHNHRLDAVTSVVQMEGVRRRVKIT